MGDDILDNTFLNTSLFNSLEVSDIDDLINFYRLKHKGYQFGYIIDPNDIRNYCYPFGLSIDKYERDILFDVATDEQLSYFNFFENNAPFFILDEHMEEIRQLKHTIIYEKYLGLEIVDSLKILIEKYKIYKEGNSISLELFKNINDIYKNVSEYHISLFLALCVGALRNGIDKLYKLEVDHKIITKIEEVYDTNFSANIHDILIESRPSECAEILFDYIQNQVGKDKISPQKKHAYINDCEVIDRIVQFNNKSYLSNEKQLFVYLSSTSKSKKIFNNFRDKLTLSVEGINYNPLKNVAHLFNDLICGEDIIEKTINNLEEIKRIFIKQKNNIDYQKLDLIDKDTISKFEEKINIYRKGSENSSLLLRFDIAPLVRQVKSLIDNKKFIFPDQDFIYFIEDILKMAEYTEELNRIKSANINCIANENDYLNILLTGINNIKSDDEYSFFKVSSGEDYVTGLYHHFPLILQVKSENAKNVIKEITNFYLGGDISKQSSKELIDFINNSIRYIFYENLPNEETEIIRLFIYMMVPKPESGENPEVRALVHIKEYFKKNTLDDYYKLDFLYLASWIARRVKYYDESTSFAEEGLQIKSDDPRFYHSISLTKYCMFCDHNDISLLDSAISNCNLAMNYYKKYDSSNIAVKKSTIAVTNAQSYFYLLKYKIKDELEYINNSRKLMDELKQLEINHNEFPEFLHTESLLLLYEYKIDNSINKINIANELIKKAIHLNPKKLYKELKEEINILLEQ